MSRVDSERQFCTDLVGLHEICKKYHVHRLSLFGSVLREDFDRDSDVDVLVEFQPGPVPGLAFFALQYELTELVGRNVDANTLEDLPIEFRTEVVRNAVVQFEAESALR